jgi:hypothetical protein
LNYPVWYLPEVGGGLLIAIIAVVHVFISHFAVGGGLWLVFAERKGIREKSEAILDFTRSHAKFSSGDRRGGGDDRGRNLVVISLVHPAATSLLIHTSFSVGRRVGVLPREIVSILIYYYFFGRMDDRTHQSWGGSISSRRAQPVRVQRIIGFMLDPAHGRGTARSGRVLQSAVLALPRVPDGGCLHVRGSVCIPDHRVPRRPGDEAFHDPVFREMGPRLLAGRHPVRDLVFPGRAAGGAIAGRGRLPDHPAGAPGGPVGGRRARPADAASRES